MHKIIVPDSNILAKILFQEPDSEQAKVFLTECLQRKCKLLVPELFIYEIMSITQYYDGDIERSFDLIQASKNANMTVISPNLALWKKSQEISRDGHSNSGFPSMYDSIYHAIAIEADGVFVTADKKHFAKTKRNEHICLLENWEDVFKE